MSVSDIPSQIKVIIEENQSQIKEVKPELSKKLAEAEVGELQQVRDMLLNKLKARESLSQEQVSCFHSLLSEIYNHIPQKAHA